MKSNYNTKDRFYEILSICNITAQEFSKHLNIDSKVFSRFTSNQKIHPQTLNVIYNLGINLNWFCLGIGDKYNNTSKGKIHKNNFKENEVDEVNFVYYKIKEWVELHFGSTQEFEQIYNLGDNESIEYVKHTNQIPYILSKKLKEAGLNINWLYHPDCDPYNTSESGRNKRAWTLKYLNQDNFIYKSLI